MAYFVTGATGFIGRHLVEELLRRTEGTEVPVYALVRERSLARLEALRARWGAGSGRVVPILGDLSRPRLGVSEEDVARLRGRVKHFFHLAALYDMRASAENLAQANETGTRHAIELAAATEAGRFHHVSSIAAAGRYRGVFREDMFEEAEGLEDPYFRTKHNSEGLVRSTCPRPWTVYRPGIVVGHSQTGEMDKIDGPYYFFKLLQRLRALLPPWFPLIGFEGGPVNLVPVDFVARAMAHIAHCSGIEGATFHLVDPEPYSAGRVMNVFAQAAHAPQFAVRFDRRAFAFVPQGLLQMVARIPVVRRITDQVLDDLGIPRRVLSYLDPPTRFDCRNAQRLLAGTGIEVPRLESYAWRLWDYWERHLDPDLHRDRTLRGAVAGKRVLVTGASSGIGRATALKLGEAGAVVLLVARSRDKLAEVQSEIARRGGRAHVYPADISNLESCDQLIRSVIAQHGGIDILVNNAGKSIRRSLELSYDRFHDFQRTMQLNYFGALKLILGFLPGMRRQRYGQIVNVSSIGVQTNPPRFSAYVASKAALDAFSRCAASELVDDNVSISTVYMPLVRTEMIAPTRIYQAFPTISPDEAAERICSAIINRAKRVSTRLGLFGQVAYAIAPKTVDIVLNTAYRIFPDSAAARGQRDVAEEPVSTEAVAFAHLIPGVHW